MIKHKPQAIRVLLVDDHVVVRTGYRALLTNSEDIEVVAEAETGEQACEKYAQHEPDVVVMDLSLPGISGFEATRRIISRNHTAQVLVFSMHDDTAFVEKSMQAGAKGYITKDNAPETLIEAVIQVASGKEYLDPRLEKNMAFQKACNRTNLFSGLTTREFEIFCLLAQGEGAASIADRICLSYKTVANYVTQIKSKLDVRTQAELVHLAMREGMIKPSANQLDE